jgi:hypothetical protein
MPEAVRSAHFAGCVSAPSAGITVAVPIRTTAMMPVGPDDSEALSIPAFGSDFHQGGTLSDSLGLVRERDILFEVFSNMRL